MTTKKNNASIVDTLSKRLAALKQYVPATTEIDIDGTAYKASDVVAVFQADLDTRAALNKSRAQAKADLALRQQAASKRKLIEDGFKAWVIGKFGANSSTAHEFGYSPRRVGRPTAKVKANAVAQSQATREARHTMGTKQKEEIHGTVPAPAAPSPPASVGTNGAQAPTNGATTHTP